MADSKAPAPVSADTILKTGDRLQVEWHGAWYPGEVMGLQENGDIKIHYAGWDDSFDEVVPRSRLMLGEPAAIAALASGCGAAGPGPLFTDSLQRLLLGEPVGPDTPLQKEQAVQVEWYGSWWAGEYGPSTPMARWESITPDGTARSMRPSHVPDCNSPAGSSEPSPCTLTAAGLSPEE